MTDESSSPDRPKKRWWQTDAAATQAAPLPSEGQPCPKCYLADLTYDTLFRLRCPVCGFVAACGAFT